MFQSTDLPVQDAEMSFFINFTVASTLPLFCGCWGEEIMCETPHVIRNSARCDDVNWGPPSDHSTSETAVRKWSLSAATSFGVVVSL